MGVLEFSSVETPGCCLAVFNAYGVGDRPPGHSGLGTVTKAACRQGEGPPRPELGAGRRHSQWVRVMLEDVHRKII